MRFLSKLAYIGAKSGFRKFSELAGAESGCHKIATKWGHFGPAGGIPEEEASPPKYFPSLLDTLSFTYSRTYGAKSDSRKWQTTNFESQAYQGN